MSRNRAALNAICLLMVSFIGCKSSQPSKTELDNVPRADTGILRLIPITGQIELLQPAKIPAINAGSGKIALAVTNDAGLRTLAHIADGSVTYLMPPEQARKFAAKYGEDRYVFSSGHNLNFISKSSPREWIETAIRNQLTKSGVKVETGGVEASETGVIARVSNLVLQVGAKGMGITASATVSFNVSLTSNAQQTAHRQITGQIVDMRAGLAGTPSDYAKALQAALEDALTQFARFVEQTAVSNK
jgi:alkanesulfonate monooxygenase SsuD/methylene tetrahydromethanopterin reductase-like flavin-dependent oxidoreductase (luciferase family)